MQAAAATGPDGPAALRVVLIAGTLARISLLERLLGDQVAVVGVARDPETAEAVVLATRPAAVLLDLDLDRGGLDAVERIMSTCPTPIVASGAAAAHPAALLAAGAVDHVGALDVPPASPHYGAALRSHLTVASRAPVIRHLAGRLRGRTEATPAATRSVQVVVVGASTGGPPALATILRDLPADLPAAVLVVQHMAEGFVDGLVRWLADLTPLTVVTAVDGERLRAGTVYLAPAGRNVVVQPGPRVALQPPDPRQFHVPSVDVALRSAAEACHGRAVGVVLTGMGRDGALGLRALREAGGATLAQDEATSVVWGMPAAARAVGGVDRELPVDRIAAAIVAAVRRPVPGDRREPVEVVVS